jgi:hypothetical protein
VDDGLWEDRERKHDGRDVVALVLALGLALSLVVFTVFLGLLALRNADQVLPIQGAGGIPENTTQILTLIFGGIIGILGSYIGAGSNKKERKDNDGPDHV